MIDFHNHLIPGVDDGASDVAESRAALAAFADDGVETVIATPHFGASTTLRHAECVRALAILDSGWSALAELGGRDFPQMRLERGVELLLDHPSPDLSDPRLRLAGTDFVLLEFPHMFVPPQSTLALASLSEAGWRPIVAHPERYSNLGAETDLILAWRDSGAFIQVNAGSLVGRYGKRARKAAWDIVSQGLADYVCSDYHSRGPTLLKPARRAMEDEEALEQWSLLTHINPSRLLGGEDPLRVHPVEPVQQSLWKRFISRG